MSSTPLPCLISYTVIISFVFASISTSTSLMYLSVSLLKLLLKLLDFVLGNLCFSQLLQGIISVTADITDCNLAILSLSSLLPLPNPFCAPLSAQGIPDGLRFRHWSDVIPISEVMIAFSISFNQRFLPWSNLDHSCFGNRYISYLLNRGRRSVIVDTQLIQYMRVGTSCTNPCIICLQKFNCSSSFCHHTACNSGIHIF